MKKNKKFWKRQAKGWREIATMETEQANYWSNRALTAEQTLKTVKAEVVALRQYNIGKNPNKTIKAEDIWVKSSWSRNIPPNPSAKKCKCKNCNCNK